MSANTIAGMHREKAPDTYFSNTNQNLVDHFPDKPGRILDIGCAEGRLGEAIIAQKHPEHYTGIEVVPDVADSAKTRLHEVLTGEAEHWLPTLPDHSYDWIILADSLEHTIDPWGVMKQVNRLLKPGGQLLVSIPNVRNLGVIQDLMVGGKWTYRPFGIMDQGHLRFFTRSSILKLLIDEGFSIRQCYSNPRNRWKKFFGKFMSRVMSLLILQPGAYEEFITVQWIIIAEKIRR